MPPPSAGGGSGTGECSSPPPTFLSTGTFGQYQHNIVYGSPKGPLSRVDMEATNARIYSVLLLAVLVAETPKVFDPDVVLVGFVGE